MFSPIYRKIIQRHQKGDTLAEIAYDYDISIARVHQLFQRDFKNNYATPFDPRSDFIQECNNFYIKST